MVPLQTRLRPVSLRPPVSLWPVYVCGTTDLLLFLLRGLSGVFRGPVRGGGLLLFLSAGLLSSGMHEFGACCFGEVIGGAAREESAIHSFQHANTAFLQKLYKEGAYQAMRRWINMLVVKAKVKDVAKEFGDYSVAADFADKLDEKVNALVKDACERAAANNRKTVMARDL